MSGEKWIEVGALVRGSIRRELLRAGIGFSEDKGMFDSLFVLDCSDAQWQRVQAWVEMKVAR